MTIPVNPLRSSMVDQAILTSRQRRPCRQDLQGCALRSALRNQCHASMSRVVKKYIHARARSLSLVTTCEVKEY